MFSKCRCFAVSVLVDHALIGLELKSAVLVNNTMNENDVNSASVPTTVSAEVYTDIRQIFHVILFIVYVILVNEFSFSGLNERSE